MTTEKFDAKSFKEFLGQPIEDLARSWGQETRFRIEREKVVAYHDRVKTTVENYHSSFDYAKEMRALGFAQTAQILYERRSNLPSLPTTQMGNFAEVMGREFGKWILGYDTTVVDTHHFNPNVDQSMKGVDIIGIASLVNSSALLLGEAKCNKKSGKVYGKDPVEESHKHLSSLYQQEFPKLLAFYKEALRLKGNQELEKALDSIYYSGLQNVDRENLIFVINGDMPRQPFKILDTLCQSDPLPNLIAVHISIEGLKNWIPTIFRSS